MLIDTVCRAVIRWASLLGGTGSTGGRWAIPSASIASWSRTGVEAATRIASTTWRATTTSSPVLAVNVHIILVLEALCEELPELGRHAVCSNENLAHLLEAFRVDLLPGLPSL